MNAVNPVENTNPPLIPTEQHLGE